MTEARLIGVHQAAAYCGLSLASFRKHVKNGSLPSPILNGRLYDIIAINRKIDFYSRLDSAIEAMPDDSWLIAAAKVSNNEAEIKPRKHRKAHA